MDDAAQQCPVCNQSAKTPELTVADWEMMHYALFIATLQTERDANRIREIVTGLHPALQFSLETSLKIMLHQASRFKEIRAKISDSGVV